MNNMTSKEALESLNNSFGENGWGFNIKERISVIEKDLEVLEILKKNMWFAPLSGFKYCCQDLIDLGNEEEFNKIKEWLENE